MTKDKNSVSGRQVFVLAVGRVSAMIIQFILPMFLARFLSKSGYGVYAQFNLLEGLFVGTINLALSSSIYYFYPRLSKERVRSMLGNSYLAFFVVTALTSLLLCWPSFRQWITGDSEIGKYIFLIMVCVFCSLCSQTVIPLYVVSKDNKTALYYPTLEIVIRALLVILIAIWIGGLEGVLIGVLITRLLMLAFVYIYAWIHTSSSLHFARLLDFGLLKEQFRYSIPFSLSGALGTITGRLDKLICISFMSEAEYAVYIVAFLGIPGIQQVYTSIGEVSLTGMSQCFKNDDYKGALSILKDLEFKAVSFSFPIVFAVCLYADKIITFVYSEKYSDSTPYFRVFIFSLLFEMLASGLIVRASGKTKISMYTAIINSIIIVPVTYFAVKNYGAWGGIFSVMLGRLVQRIAYAFFEIKIVHSNWREYMPWRQIGIIFSVSLFAIIPFFILRRLWNSNVIFSGILAAIYIGIAFAIEIHLKVFIVKKDVLIRVFNRGLTLLKQTGI